jgi:hypothetical protein
MEALCLSYHPFKTSHFLEQCMTYPARLQQTYWLPFVRTTMTLGGSLLLAAKDRRIKELEQENQRLKEELKIALGKLYERL